MDKYFKEVYFILLNHEGVSSFIGKFLPWRATTQNMSSTRCHAKLMFTINNLVSSTSHLVHFVVVLAKLKERPINSSIYLHCSSHVSTTATVTWST
jgi:hypothetical protein